MKSKLTCAAMALMLASLARADYNPIPITPGSFNADVIVENTAPKPFNDYTTATMDGGTNNNAWVWYEQGYASNLPDTGIPAHGSTFSAADGSSRQFTMPPNYDVNNVLCVYSAIPSATLTLTEPTSASTLSVLIAGGGASTINYTVHYQGGGTQSGTLNVDDWFNTGSSTIAWYARGRVNMDNGNLGNLSANPNSGSPRLFYQDVVLTDTLNPVASIDFSSSSGNRAVIFGLSGSTDNVNFSAIAVSGFNRDMVIEATAPHTGAYLSLTTVTMDQGINNYGNTWYEKGFNRGNTGSGIPNANSTFSIGNHTYQMAPSYAGNDVLFVSAQVTSGTLTLNTPATLSALSFLNSAGNGPVSVNYTVHHADSSTEFGAFNSLDWFNTSATPAFIANGRFQPETVGLNNVNGNPQVPRAFFNDVTISSASPVTSIDFSYSSGGRAMIFAVSGSSDGTTFIPLAVSGYNADGIAEASAAARPNPLYTATTASMDGGVGNTGATWYEQGFYHLFPNTGLPPAGSTLNSGSLPDHHYQMPASYSANNAIYVDSTHPTANLTPVTPAWFSGLSFLSATANGRLTNQCIIQYSDGTSETNTFVSQDWFNNTPYAFAALGRVNLDSLNVNNDPGHTGTPNPRLYEAQFALNGPSSVTITNVLLTFLGAQNPTTGRMVVLAVSGTTGPVAPIVRSQPAGVIALEGSNVVLSVTMGGGTPPFSFQWQVGTNNVWVDLTDGGNISGTTSTSVNFSSIGWTNSADYRFIATGVGGSSTSAVATVTVLSGLADVTQPGDAITSFIGTTPAAEGVEHAIDNTVGTSGKYLNYGTDGDTAAPFAGPVGFVVTPAVGKTILSVIRFYTANDATERDPADYVLEGSNDGGNNWNPISSGALNLPTARNAAAPGPLNPLTQAIQEVRFGNATAYGTYRVTFNNLRNNTTANSMQIGEVELLGVQAPAAPVITVQPPGSLKAYAGASVNYTVAAVGFPTNLTYQWSVNGSAVSAATSSTFVLNNVQPSDSGKTVTATVANSVGSASTIASTLTVISRPTESYPTAILTDNPVGFWHLDEGPDDGAGNAGKVANDYVGGHAGIYTNTVLGLPGYNAPSDSDTAAQFGVLSGVDSFVGGIQGIGFAAPTNTSATFSVEAWVNGPAQSVDAGIVTKGAGGGGEQFNLDTGGTGHAFRFFVRDVAGAVYGVSSTNQPDGAWHHVVGVCDEVNSNIVLYVDGLLRGTTTISPSNGLLSSASAVSIGARRSSATSAYNNQFNGTVDEVAIYNIALNSNQVLNHFFAAQKAPLFSVQPTNTTAPEGSTAAFYSAAYGAGTVGYQWYQSVDGVTFTPLSGKTSATLTLPNVPAANNGYFYQVVAANSYGSVTSAVAQLNVVSGPPYFLVDLPFQDFVYAGRTLTLSITMGGTAPFTYQWQANGVNLNDGGRISGAHSNVLTVANAQPGDSAVYQVLVSNSAGGPVTSSQDTVTVSARPSFNTTGVGWTVNNGATIFNNILQLTDGTGITARSSFFNFPLYIDAFAASFTYQDVGGGGADGMTFVLHNDPRGPSALGGAGGSLGVSGITPSAELEFNIYGPNTPGIAVHANGATGGYSTTDPVSIASGDPIRVNIVYAQGNLNVTLVNTTLGLSFTTNYSVDLPALVGGNTAYVGMTAATGGTASTQQVTDFTFVPFPVVTAQQTGANLLLSWPASIGGFVLQQRADLSSGTWQNVNATVTSLNGYNQVTLPAAGTSAFYRLALP